MDGVGGEKGRKRIRHAHPGAWRIDTEIRPWEPPPFPAGGDNWGLVAFPVHPLPQKLAVTTHGFGLFPSLAFGRLFIGTAQFHLPEDTFTLHLLFERFQRLIDVVVAYDYVNDGPASCGWR
jgi:hypothetical protein